MSERRHKKYAGRTPPMVLKENHPAVVESRTLFPSQRLTAFQAGRVLKSGMNSRKLGKTVTKGRWKGFPIFMLTLEERYTCPTRCLEWRSCYGNRSHWADRIEAGPALEAMLEEELRFLQHKHPQGFVVRLHNLGDFYSLEYIERWHSWLRKFPALHVWGYTAHDPSSIMGRMLATPPWRRWAMRFSGSVGERGTTVFGEEGPPPGGIACPEQTGKTACCATCALCWGSVIPIAFRRH